MANLNSPQPRVRRGLMMGVLFILIFILMFILGVVVGKMLQSSATVTSSPELQSHDSKTSHSPTPLLISTSAEVPPSTLANHGAESHIYIEYILDASDSMREQLPDGTYKRDTARDVLISHLNTFSPSAHIGLRVYGHRLNWKGQEAASCQDIELIAPVEIDQLEKIETWLQEFPAQGMTPLAEAISRAVQDFQTEPDRVNTIVMISDGEETCGGDPCETVADLKAQDINFTLYVVGMDVDPQAQAQLQCMAEQGDGFYRDARSKVELIQVFGEIQQEMAANTSMIVKSTPTPVSTSKPTSLPIVPQHPKQLSFIGDDGDIWLVEVKNGVQTQLTDMSGIGHYDWSPTGQWLVFEQWNEANHASGIYLFNLESGERRKVLDDYSVGESIAWSPIGDWIAFDTYDGISNFDLVMLVNTSTGEVREVFRTLNNGVGRGCPLKKNALNWSSDGNRLAVNLYANDALILFPHNSQSVLDLDKWDPQIAPDGNRIAWLDEDLVITTIAGEELHRFSSGNCVSAGPNMTLAWSPDGQYIALSGSNVGICLIEVETGSMHPMVVESITWNPVWSADGFMIAFSYIVPVEPWGSEEKAFGILDIRDGHVIDLPVYGREPDWRP